MPDFRSILAALAGGGGGLVDRLDKRDLLKQQTARQQSQDALQKLVAEAQLAKINAPVAEEWEKLETDSGWFERNPRTGQVRPILDPTVTAPSAPAVQQSGSVGFGLDDKRAGVLQSLAQQAPTQAPAQGQRVLQPKRPTPTTPQPRGPVRGTPEYLKAIEDEERLRASLRPPSSSQEDRTLVPVQQADGTVVYTPRSQAAGQQAPRGQGQGGTERQKRIQALANTRDALNNFEAVLSSTGSQLLPSADKDVLRTAYENLQLQMKEGYNLGVLNGPDLLLMRRVLGDPTDPAGRVRSFGSGKEQTKRSLAQVAEFRKILDQIAVRLEQGNAALTPETPGGGRGGGRGLGAPQPTPPASADPEFDALMAKAKKRGGG